jgi:hypothetical protein
MSHFIYYEQHKHNHQHPENKFSLVSHKACY